MEYLVEKGCPVTAEMFYLSCKAPNLAVTHFVLDKLKEQGYTGEKLDKEVINGRFDKT